MTRLALLAAALLCGAAAPVADSGVVGDPRSALERHWLAYAELQRQKDLRPH